jgi:osmoprotectant transport system permease protein
MKRVARNAAIVAWAGFFAACATVAGVRAAAAADAAPRTVVRVASKKFTESVILGEAVVQLIRAAGDPAEHLAELGGTRLVYDALRRGEIDAYPEYTGTLEQEIFAGQDTRSPGALQRLLQADGIAMTRSLGFANNYALAVRREVAERLGLKRISDLARHPDLRLALSSEFIDRADGWRNLQRAYNLPHQSVSGMDHEIAYRQLAAKSADLTDVYTTDAKIAELDLVVLADDRGYFPSYDAVLLMRVDLAARFPRAAEQLARLEGQITPQDMIALNALVERGEATDREAAARLVDEKFGIKSGADRASVASAIWGRTREHLALVAQSLVPAILVAVPLGVLAAKRPRVGRALLGAVGVVQTIPALALLVLLIAPLAYFQLPTVGAGSWTAVVALFLYSLLPIVQNTATGLSAIPREYHESAAALGLSPAFRLWHIELPLASPAILAGVRTAAVLNVGFATLGALVGAGGYGQPILTGIRLSNTSLILQGAIPAAALALALQAGFEIIERWFVPAGLRAASGASRHE